MTTEILYTHKGEVKISENKIYVPIVTIDATRVPARRFHILFDTGAFITLLSKERAQRYSYKIVEEKGCVISGFSEKGLVCDLRKIPTAVFCGFHLENVLVATPHNDGITVTEVLGMNILENFNFGINLNEEAIYLDARKGFDSQKPKYRCGKVSLFQDVSDKHIGKE